MRFPLVSILSSLALFACRAPQTAPESFALLTHRTPIEFGETPPDNQSYGDIVEPALARAKWEDKLVLLYFSSQISSTVEAFRANVLSDGSVAERIDESFVFVDVDLHWDTGVVAKYRPGKSNSAMIVSADGELLAWVPTRREPFAFLTELELALDAIRMRHD